ncbi:MAG: hypothetical protein MUD00_02955 [Candidatus Pacebacteria bacterium]|jgi:hypothetical protein|nr:hypothetical protein [Candidatus Paceibacterota bacterium]
MNTIARGGKTVLKTLFLKMNIFGDVKIDIENRSVTYPKLPEKREVIVSKHSPEMEEGGYKEYQGKIRGCTKREDRCKVFTWSAVIGLIEIPWVNSKEKIPYLLSFAQFTCDSDLVNTT